MNPGVLRVGDVVLWRRGLGVRTSARVVWIDVVGRQQQVVSWRLAAVCSRDIAVGLSVGGRFVVVRGDEIDACPRTHDVAVDDLIGPDGGRTLTRAAYPELYAAIARAYGPSRSTDRLFVLPPVRGPRPSPAEELAVLFGAATRRRFEHPRGQDE